MTESELEECSSYYKDGTASIDPKNTCCGCNDHIHESRVYGRIIKSPREACRLGYSQPFEVASVVVAEEGMIDDGAEDEMDLLRDPIAALIAEHNVVLSMVDKVEEQLVSRNLDGLWIATNDLDNILHLHSGIKEEEVLFPALRGLVPFGEGLIVCINEDHREIASLVHAFREALRDDTINDKVIGSAIVALRSHVRKEDNEFFEFVKRYVTEEMKDAIMEDLLKAEKAFVPREPGERMPDEERAAERHSFHSKAMTAREIALDTCCH